MSASNLIEEATSYDTSICLIPKKECLLGIKYLQDNVAGLLGIVGQASLIPIETGGRSLGKRLHSVSKEKLLLNPMRMSHYGPQNEYLPRAVCKELPDINKIALPGDITLPVIFADAVVESQGTIMGAIMAIDLMIDSCNDHYGSFNPHPEYYSLALVSKISNETQIPNFIYAFKVDHRIWVHGWSCDDGRKGRTKRAIWGRQAEDATTVPKPPYYQRAQEFTHI